MAALTQRLVGVIHDEVSAGADNAVEKKHDTPPTPSDGHKVNQNMMRTRNLLSSIKYCSSWEYGQYFSALETVVRLYGLPYIPTLQFGRVEVSVLRPSIQEPLSVASTTRGWMRVTMDCVGYRGCVVECFATVVVVTEGG